MADREFLPKLTGYAIPKARRERREHVPLDCRKEGCRSLMEFVTSFVFGSSVPRSTSKQRSSVFDDGHVGQLHPRHFGRVRCVASNDVLRVGLEGWLVQIIVKKSYLQ